MEELENSGVAALTVEDTDLPQVFGSGGRTQMLDIDEGVGKMKAALSGRRDRSLAIAGRTSAMSVLGIEDAIARGRAYQSAGIDAMFFTGVSETHQIEALASAIDVPIFLGGSGTGLLADRKFLSRNHVRISLQGHHPYLAAVKATYETLALLRNGTSPNDIPGKPPSDLIKNVTRADDYQRWIEEFLGG